MKGIVCLLILLLISIRSFSQPGATPPKKIYELKRIDDTYVVTFVINKKVFSEKCNCVASKDSVCSLYEGSIKVIYHCPERTIFNSTSLSKVQFFIADASLNLKENGSYLATLCPATNKQYLKVASLLTLDDPQNYKFINIGPYLSGVSNCAGFCDKILFKVGVKRTHNKNYKNKDKFSIYTNKTRGYLKVN